MSIKHLVLAGGAYKGLYIIGAMNELIKQNYIDIMNVESLSLMLDILSVGGWMSP